MAEGTKFCSNCGGDNTVVETPAVEVKAAPTTTSVDPKQVLIFGIIGLACACTVWLSIVGIIFAIIAGKKAKTLEAELGAPLTGVAKVGKLLAKIGLIVNIAMMVLGVCSFFFGVFLGILAGLADMGGYAFIL